MSRIRATVLTSALGILVFLGCEVDPQPVQRPEKILSMREVVYDNTTYTELAALWKKYNDAYPSEDAYANWMYAARYAGAEDYASLLETGARKYPANPTLLYLKAMVRHGASDNLEEQTLLERAVALDPSTTDPWFGLVINYLQRDEREKMNVALRKILEAGAIADEVMDYSYNMLSCLDQDAILVTNGDNDTYPGWILTRIVGYRPDVRIVNRALLNTDWYPLALLKEDVPTFVTAESLDSLRTTTWKSLEESKSPVPSWGPYSDPLIDRLVAACGNAGRPVYLAVTLTHSDVVKELWESGRELGPVTLVTPPEETDPSQLRRVVKTWLEGFRTGGMDSWDIRYAKETRAGRMLVQNYGAALRSQMDRIVKCAPEYRLGLFRWYRDHLLPLVADRHLDDMNRMWCRSDDIGEIRDWCRSKNLLK
jgi:hypothetical protein